MSSIPRYWRDRGFRRRVGAAGRERVAVVGAEDVAVAVGGAGRRPPGRAAGGGAGAGAGACHGRHPPLSPLRAVCGVNPDSSHEAAPLSPTPKPASPPSRPVDPASRERPEHLLARQVQLPGGASGPSGRKKATQIVRVRLGRTSFGTGRTRPPSSPESELPRDVLPHGDRHWSGCPMRAGRAARSAGVPTDTESWCDSTRVNVAPLLDLRRRPGRRAIWTRPAGCSGFLAVSVL